MTGCFVPVTDLGLGGLRKRYIESRGTEGCAKFSAGRVSFEAPAPDPTFIKGGCPLLIFSLSCVSLDTLPGLSFGGRETNRGTVVLLGSCPLLFFNPSCMSLNTLSGFSFGKREAIMDMLSTQLLLLLPLLIGPPVLLLSELTLLLSFSHLLLRAGGNGQQAVT